jgi:predicted chitinase
MLDERSLEQIMRNASRARLQQFTPALLEAMKRFDIADNLRRAAAFIAQLAHESGEFRFMEEIWGPTAAQERYEPQRDLARRLGNTEPGDGKRYKGRGPIQVTGRANYRKYGDLLGVDLVAQPELAATPATGLAVAGLFWQRNGLNALADQGDFKEITRRINGGSNGLAERQKFYDRALAVLASSFPAMAPPQGAPAQEPWQPFERGMEHAGKEIKPRAVAKPVDRKLDARPDTTDFRDTMYVPTLTEVPTHIPLGDFLDYDVPVLDQGKEGACTGYGLATVANYLQLRRRVLPEKVPVSPRMLYNMARRYDEWPGEDYEGSSARGAMKGWHKHGVCREELYPSAGKDDGKGLTEMRTSEARKRPLGAYFRVNHKDLVAMHSAIAEVGVLYATSMVHEGWQQVGGDGAIRSSERIIGGHAFAIVAYDDEGFWLQNSWGTDWGAGGFAHLTYDDWLRNGTDVWVARLGAPVTLRTAEATATAHSAAAGESIAYSFADLRPHIVSVGNNGELRAGGDYGTSPQGLQHIFDEDIPRVTHGWKKPRILLYAHGGLVGEEAAVQRLAEYRPHLLEKEVYPLAFIWRTDYWTTIKNILQDAVRRRRPEGALDAAKDFMLDRLDDALEPLARALTGKRAWDEMKENALAASKSGGAADLVVRHVQRLYAAGAEVHLVGHSAGSILLGPVATSLAAAGVPIASCSLWAPACTMALFNKHYRPAIENQQIGRFGLYVLNDKTERDDNCGKIYNKSLLYLVSDAFEDKIRIPSALPGVLPDYRAGVPVLGLEKCLGAKERALFDGTQHQLVIAPNQADPASGTASQARAHGAFDDDPATVMSTFLRVLGEVQPQQAPAPVQARPAIAAIKFRKSSGSLRDRRQNIDVMTSVRNG